MHDVGKTSIGIGVLSKFRYYVNLNVSQHCYFIHLFTPFLLMVYLYGEIPLVLPLDLQ